MGFKHLQWVHKMPGEAEVLVFLDLGLGRNGWGLHEHDVALADVAMEYPVFNVQITQH
jgi:hypothetical protein